MTQRRTLLRALPGLAGVMALAAGLRPAAAAERQVEDLGLSLKLPEAWIPIPRAEVLEAVARAREAGAADDWTLRAGWQRLPHLRWFTLPHLLMATQPAPGQADQAPGPVLSEVGQAGSRAVHSHRVLWVQQGQRCRLQLLALADEAALMAGIRDSLRRKGQPLAVGEPSSPVR